MTPAQIKKVQRQRRARFRRARVRKILFTSGPDRLLGGRIRRRHLAKDVIVREIDVASPLWPKAFDGLRIGHVSDFHLGELMPVDHALEIVETLADQEPDLVACTGDLVDLRHDDALPLLEALASVNAPLGSFAVLGNHDELHCPDILSEMATEVGLPMLRNEAVRISHNGGHLVVAGVEWAKSTSQCARFVDQVCGNDTHLLLAHNPKSFVQASQCSVALSLSGHTHGGQVAMKNRPGANLAAASRYTAGLYERGHSRLYVTTGVGAWFPVRVYCPAEIAIVTMRHQDDVGEAPVPPTGWLRGKLGRMNGSS